MNGRNALSMYLLESPNYSSMNVSSTLSRVRIACLDHKSPRGLEWKFVHIGYIFWQRPCINQQAISYFLPPKLLRNIVVPSRNHVNVHGWKSGELTSIIRQDFQIANAKSDMTAIALEGGSDLVTMWRAIEMETSTIHHCGSE